MFRNYLKIAIRNLLHSKTTTLIKIAGLSVALAVSISVFSWTARERSYDKFHRDSGRIFRLKLNDENIAVSPAFRNLLQGIPEIEQAVRLFKLSFLGRQVEISDGKQIYTNDEIYYADDNFFDVFSFPLLEGDPQKVLQPPQSAVITQSAARQFFGNDDPLGKTLSINNYQEITITGVIKDIPDNSHFHFDILITMKSHFWNLEEIGFGSSWVFPTYVKLVEHADPEIVCQKINEAFLASGYSVTAEFNIALQPLTSIHLHSHYEFELENNNDIRYVYLFALIGILIIVTGCINYINLTVAAASRRIKEIAVRKTLGASRKQLLRQLTLESVVISIISFIVALVLLELFKEFLLKFTTIDLSFASIGTIIFCAFGLTLVIGIITGVISAWDLSNYNLTGSSGSCHSVKSGKSRSVLVIMQFCISIVLILSTIVIFRQRNYIGKTDLGFDRNQVLVLHTNFRSLGNKLSTLKAELSQNPAIIDMTSCSQLPTNIITTEGLNTEEGKDYQVYFIKTDRNFFNTLDINVIKGWEEIRNLEIDPNESRQDFANRYVVNRKFLSMIDLPIDETDRHKFVIRHGNMQPGSIIGVVDDFHFASLHSEIHPLVIEFIPEDLEYLLIKISANDIPGTIAFIEKEWNELAGGLPFQYSFLDENFEVLYSSEQQTSRLFLVFTLISVFIIMLGLFGLISYTIIQKTKEIGIRKVMGASSGSIVGWLVRELVKWVILANLIALPLAWFAMHRWLENFAYHIDLSLFYFVFTALIAFVIGFFTVFFQTIKAANASPVESLKYE
ncbi:MAG TPA: ABC transporter permease [Candidatus Cloacimonadota bacterium]|nr:ABC transporter permease [Candidatus Cloacimonadota bacterium]